MKIYNYEVVFQEFPDEVTLALNISNCPCHCKGCHSPFLAENKGVKLNVRYLKKLIKENPGITCVGFMGGDADPGEVMQWAGWLREYDENLKIGWYSGRDSIPPNFNIMVFDYIKLGHYDKDRGPLTSKRTNQEMMKMTYKRDEDGMKYLDEIVDITPLFWKENP